MNTLTLQHISKTYGSTKAAVDVSFTLTEGIYGLIGPNGAGKSTLMNIITTNIEQYEGTLLYNEKKVSSLQDSYRSILGYMPQHTVGYEHFKAEQFLYYMAALKGIERKAAAEKIAELSRLFHLNDALSKKIKAYSGGMRQRLMFLQALLNDPKILILDEPTAGLDPIERITMRNYIAQLGKEKIILIATHVMQDIETIAHQVLLIKKGRLLFEGEISALLASVQGKIEEVRVEQKEWESFAATHPITRCVQTKTHVIAHCLSDAPVCEHALLPTLEEAYFYYMR